MTDTPPPPGFYPDAQGTSRWWDGQQWTERVQEPPARVGLGSRLADAGRSLLEKSAPSERTDAVWSATGKPITGIGGGRYALTPEYLYFESGTLRTNAQQIRTHEIFDVDGRQSIAQKARGLGTITLHARRADGSREAVLLEDVPNFREGVTAINDAAHSAREALRQRENTQHVNYQGSPLLPSAPTTPSPVAAPAAQSMDLNAELERLAGFHQAGVLTDEEFTAAKRKLLGI